MSSDEDFQRRLDEVNRELLETMNRNEVKREELQHTIKEMQRPGGTGYFGRTAATTIGAPGAPADMPHVLTSSDIVAREVQIAVAQEMKHFEQRVREMVFREWEVRVSELDQLLRGRFAEMQIMHEKMSTVLIETASNLNQHRKESREAQGLLRNWVEDEMSGLRREWNEAHRNFQREHRQILDIVEEVRSSTRHESTQANRKLDETLRRISDTHTDTLVAADSKLNQVRLEAQDLVRAQIQKERDEIDLLYRQLSTAQRQSSSAEAIAEKLNSVVGELQDQYGANASEVRQLQGDVTQLELLMKKKTEKLERISAAVGQGGTQAAAGVDLGLKMQHDVFALQQSVAYLAGVLEDNKLLPLSGGGLPRPATINTTSTSVTSQTSPTRRKAESSPLS